MKYEDKWTLQASNLITIFLEYRKLQGGVQFKQYWGLLCLRLALDIAYCLLSLLVYLRLRLISSISILHLSLSQQSSSFFVSLDPAIRLWLQNHLLICSNLLSVSCETHSITAMSGNQPVSRPTCLTALLTQPLIPSPVINWILPARLRDKDHNDVVFIGERRIQIKEALPNGHLQDVVEKSDLEGSLIGAKVINVSTQLPWETQPPSSLMAHPHDKNQLPPQILFLATDSNELLFMYYSEIGDGPFVSYSRPLPRDVNIADKYGKHIAVDPK